MQLQEILSRISNVKRQGNGYTGRCPGHDDRQNSLSISEGADERILIHCHAGCTPEGILSAMGLKLADLYPAIETKAGKKIVSEYLYKDLDGKTIHKTIRYEPKSFTQCRPDGKGGWIYNLKGTTTIIYNLKEVSEAISKGETIYIVEGEKDCENMGKLGLVATTSPMGAGKWQDHYSDYLINASVVIIPDNDEAGKRHSDQISASLYRKAKSIKVIELPNVPPKGDITDFFKMIGNRFEGIEILNKLVVGAHEWEPRAKDNNNLTICLADVEAEEIEWLWDPYIPLGKLTLVQGDPGDGKTTFVLNVAAIISNGGALPENEGYIRQEPGIVIYQTAEDGLGDTIKPRLQKANADCSKIFVIDESQKGLTLSDERIEKVLHELRPKLFIIDPLQAYLGAKTDMHRANEVRPLLSKIGRLAEQYGCAIIFIMHLSKASQSRSLYRGLGSIDIPAAARSVLLVGKNPNNPQERAIAHVKSSLAPIGKSIAFELHPEYGFCWKGTSELTADDMLATRTIESNSKVDEAKEYLESLLINGAELSAREIYNKCEYAGFPKRTVERAKAELNIIVEKKGYGSSSRWIWRLPLKDRQFPKSIQLAAFDEVLENTAFVQRPPNNILSKVGDL